MECSFCIDFTEDGSTWKLWKLYVDPLLKELNNDNLNIKSSIYTNKWGNFFTLYPHKKNLYTLGSVKYSRFKKFKNLKSATIFSKNISKKEIVKRKEMSEKIVLNFFPSFSKDFSFKTYYKSMTTLFNSKKDSRPTLINKEKKLCTMNLILK